MIYIVVNTAGGGCICLDRRHQAIQKWMCYHQHK